MRQILLSIFVLFLIGCNQNEKFSKAEDLSAVAKKAHFTASNLVITTSEDTANNLSNSTANTGDHDTENILKNNISDPLNSQIVQHLKRFSYKLMKPMTIYLMSGIITLFRFIMHISLMGWKWSMQLMKLRT